MSEEPNNPYYFYDNYSKKDLEDSLKKKISESDSYRRWLNRSLEEVIYIQDILDKRRRNEHV